MNWGYAPGEVYDTWLRQPEYRLGVAAGPWQSFRILAHSRSSLLWQLEQSVGACHCDNLYLNFGRFSVTTWLWLERIPSHPTTAAARSLAAWPSVTTTRTLVIRRDKDSDNDHCHDCVESTRDHHDGVIMISESLIAGQTRPGGADSQIDRRSLAWVQCRAIWHLGTPMISYFLYEFILFYMMS